MNKTYPLGSFYGLQFSFRFSALIATGILWIVLAFIGHLLSLTWAQAILGGLVGVALHFFGETWHQLGHAWAARRTGYPMQGVEFWLLLGRSIYPADEPELPGRVHIRRALGGAPASFLLTLIAGVLVLTVRDQTVMYWLAWFAFLENFLVFTLGAFLPLGFTDGSTLLRYWRKE